ncbi:MAG: TIM barrel protein [Pseudomonadota bacterium]
MRLFSANLGFLWTDRPLPDAIRAAKAAGFDAVECHWPYLVPAEHVKQALDETGLPLLGLNTSRGNVEAGQNGLSAVPGCEEAAKAAVDEALTYAEIVGARSVHVMAGFAEGDAAHDCFLATLRYACDAAAQIGVQILVEPLNRHDAPGYFLKTTDQAQHIISQIGVSNLKLMFDCYHVGRNEGDVISRLSNLLPIVGHILFASVPDRGPPDHGELDYRFLFDAIEALGWTQPLGAEYKPVDQTDASLAWMDAFGIRD